MPKPTRLELMRAFGVMVLIGTAIFLLFTVVPALVIFGIVTVVTDWTLQTRLAVAFIGGGVLMASLEAIGDYRQWRKRLLKRKKLGT